MVSTFSSVCAFGTPAPDFALPGTDGHRHSRASCAGPNGLLVMFLCNHCPYVKAVLERIVRDTRELAAHGIGSVAIMSNDPRIYPEDDFAHMMRVSSQFAFPFPYLFDEDQSVARAFGAVCTPDFFGYNAALTLQYRGRLDASRKEALPDARRDLFEAMIQVATTGCGPAEQQAGVGCSIKWREEN